MMLIFSKVKSVLCPKKKETIHKKKGVALSLEALFMVVVFGWVAQQFISQLVAQKENDEIASVAKDISQVNNGLRRLMSDFFTHLDALETISGFGGIATDGATVTFTDIDFLKASAGSCTAGNIASNATTNGYSMNIPVDGYLPCTMRNETALGHNYNIRITNVAGDLRTEVTIKTPVHSVRKKEGLIAQKIAEKAKSFSENYSYINTYWDIISNEGISISSPDYTSTNWGEIVVRIALGGNSENWLSLDGSSTMRGDIDVGDNQVNNVSLLSGDSLNNQLEVTADSYFSGVNGVYIENTLNTNSLLVRDALKVNGDSILEDIYARELNLSGDAVLNNAELTGLKINGNSPKLGQGIYFAGIVNTGSGNITINKPICDGGTPIILATPAYPVASRAGVYYGSYVEVTGEASWWSLRVKEKYDTDYNATGKSADAQVLIKCQ